MSAAVAGEASGMTAVLSAPRALQGFVTGNLTAPVMDVIVGHERVYVLHHVDRHEVGMSFSDPLDGELLISLNYFESERAARVWVAQREGATR
jgi:hypothetical protein